MNLFFNAAVHDVQPYTSTHFNMTHKIRHLSFGLNIPGKTNPMDDTTVIATEGMFLLLKPILLRIQWSAFLQYGHSLEISSKMFRV